MQAGMLGWRLGAARSIKAEERHAAGPEEILISESSNVTFVGASEEPVRTCRLRRCARVLDLVALSAEAIGGQVERRLCQRAMAVWPTSSGSFQFSYSSLLMASLSRPNFR